MTTPLVVVSVGVGSWYVDGVARLVDTVQRYNSDAEMHVWSNRWPPYSPSHLGLPYAFKYHAIRAAIMERADAGKFGGVILWMDASMMAVGSLAPIVERAVEYGVCAWDSEHKTGEWCSDACLNVLGVSRDDAMNIPLATGGLVAFDVGSTVGFNLLEKMDHYAKDVNVFGGPWDNRAGQCSLDSRCRGHRHDMPPLSVLLWRNEVPLLPKGSLFDYHRPGIEADDRIVVVAKGGVP